MREGELPVRPRWGARPWPRGLWTRTVKGPGGSRGQYIPVEQIDQVRGELDNYAQFAALVEDYIEINEELCKAGSGRRPAATDALVPPTTPAAAGYR